MISLKDSLLIIKFRYSGTWHQTAVPRFNQDGIVLKFAPNVLKIDSLVCNHPSISYKHEKTDFLARELGAEIFLFTKKSE